MPPWANEDCDTLDVYPAEHFSRYDEYELEYFGYNRRGLSLAKPGNRTTLLTIQKLLSTALGRTETQDITEHDDMTNLNFGCMA